MLTLNVLFKQVNEHYPDQDINLLLALKTWAEDADCQGELGSLIEPCGLGLGELIPILDGFAGVPLRQDGRLLAQALTQGLAGQPLAAALLWVLCEAPHDPLTRELVHRGLDLQCLKQSLLAIHPDPALLETVISEDDHKMPTLTQYGRNLTALAHSGAFADLYPRQKELDQLILILMKTQKGNAVITGPAGAGKTALVELLARAIAEGNVPEPLREAVIYEVSLSRLVAGTMYRGQFEARLETLLAELKANPQAILFVDEMHLIWGAGRTSNSAMDAANILKPFLARGEVRMIGATTTEDYHRYLAQDHALERRFEAIPLAAPSGALLLNLVDAMGHAISQKTGVNIPDGAVEAAVRLTDRYLPQRSQPDKAVNLLDLAAATARVAGDTAVTKTQLLSILADQTGQPVAELDAGGRESLAGMEARINQQLIGQGEAVSQVMQALVYRRQLADSGQDRNLGTFLFAGPTGVGKTELGRILAREFYGSPDRLLQVDLAEYTHSATASRLIGSAPGLVGHENPGLLADFLHTAGSGVIIFDEIEKAHPDIRDFLLGILDNGRVRTGKGELLSTRGCIVIATTNALTEDDLVSKGFGFAGTLEEKSAPELLRHHFPPEFLGRFDELILFRSLTQADLRAIVNLRLDETLAVFAQQGITISFDRAALVNHILARLEGGGARGVRRAIEKHFSQQVASQMLSGQAAHWEVLP